MIELLIVALQMVVVALISFGVANGAPWWFDATGVISLVRLADLMGAA
jgi:hypothetical protein